jgi:dihydroflavonol-4-reductase
MTRRAAITGATGFLGLALSARLRELGWSVTGLARESSRAEALAELDRLGVSRVRGDVTRPASLPPLLEGADVVFHCAAVIGYRRRLEKAMQAVNVDGTRHVLEACRLVGTGRLVHVSSIAAVGINDSPRTLDEEAVWQAGPLRMGYFTTKHRSEQLVREQAAAGLDAVVVNPAAIYGPSVVPSNSNQLVQRVAAGRLRLAPEGGINVVPLETVVEGTVAAAERGATGRRYILGGENLSMAELLVRIARAAGRTLRPGRLPTWTGPWLRAAMNALEPLVPEHAWYTPDLCASFGRWMWFDISRMQRELGVEPADLDACLAATVAQLRERGLLPRT